MKTITHASTATMTLDGKPFNGVFYDEEDQPLAICSQGVVFDLSRLDLEGRLEKVARFKEQRRRAKSRAYNEGQRYLDMSRGH